MSLPMLLGGSIATVLVIAAALVLILTWQAVEYDDEI